MQAVVGSQLCLIDVSAFIRCFEQDGNFSLEQLNRLSELNPQAIPLLLAQWPHVINFRDGESGATVLHHVASGGFRQRSEGHLWKCINHWLSFVDFDESTAKVPGGVNYELLVNHNGQTALDIAVEKQSAGNTHMLLTALNPKLPLKPFFAIC
jgi:ankyrin repeat protein